MSTTTKTTKRTVKQPTKRSAVKTKAPTKPTVKAPTKPTVKAKAPTKPTVKAKAQTKAETRCTIARDVLAQLKAKVIIPTQGFWAEDSKLGDFDSAVNLLPQYGNDPSCSIRDFALGITKCKCCALGSIFLSTARIFDNMKVDMGTDCPSAVFEDLGSSPLSNYFLIAQLELIESCFEGGDGMYSPDEDESWTLAVGYKQQYPNATKRLTAIMENILRNKGTFCPIQDVTKEALIKVGR